MPTNRRSLGLVPWFTLLVSLLALGVSIFFAYVNYIQTNDANQIAQMASSEAQKANQIAKVTFGQNFLYERYKTSMDIANKAFEEIWEDPGFQVSYSQMERGQQVKDPSLLKASVNTFEDVGSRYCQGLLFRADLVLAFKGMLSKICNDKNIEDYFEVQQHKNMTAYLCSELISPKTLIAQHYKEDPTCTPPKDPKDLQNFLQEKMELEILK